MAASVLIVDQDEEFASQLEDVLHGVGVEVIITNDGKKGIDLATEKPPTAIVLCVELAKMSGYSVCAKLKKDAALKNVPIIITSSEATPETFDQHKKLKSRAEEYLKKPFPPALLLEVLKPYAGPYLEQPAEVAAVDIVDATEQVEFEDNTPPEQVGTTEYVAPEAGAEVAPEALGAALGGGVGVSDADPTGDVYAAESEALTTVGFPGAIPSRPPPRDTGHAQEIAKLRANLAELEDKLASITSERDQALANVTAAKAEAEAAMSMRPAAGAAGGSNREVVELKKERVLKEKEIIRLREELNAKENERMAWLEKETELEDRIVALEDSLEQERTQRGQTEAKLAGEHARLAGLEASHAQASEDLRRRLNETVERETELAQKLEESQAALEATQASLAETQAALAESQNGHAASHAAFEESQAALTAAHENIEHLNARVAELEQEGEQTRGVLVERDNEIAELKAKTAADEEEINRLRSELENMTAEAGSLSEQLAAKTEEANGLAVDKTAVEEHLQTTKEELDSFRERTGQLEEEREQTQAFIAMSEEKRAKAMSALEIALALLKEGGEPSVGEAEVVDDGDVVDAAN